MKITLSPFSPIREKEVESTSAALSAKQKEYQTFFKKLLKDEFGVNSPAELTTAQKSEFFTMVENLWTKDED